MLQQRINSKFYKVVKKTFLIFFALIVLMLSHCDAQEHVKSIYIRKPLLNFEDSTSRDTFQTKNEPHNSLYSKGNIFDEQKEVKEITKRKTIRKGNRLKREASQAFHRLGFLGLPLSDEELPFQSLNQSESSSIPLPPWETEPSEETHEPNDAFQIVEPGLKGIAGSGSPFDNNVNETDFPGNNSPYISFPNESQQIGEGNVVGGRLEIRNVGNGIPKEGENDGSSSRFNNVPPKKFNNLSNSFNGTQFSTEYSNVSVLTTYATSNFFAEDTTNKHLEERQTFLLRHASTEILSLSSTKVPDTKVATEKFLIGSAYAPTSILNYTSTSTTSSFDNTLSKVSGNSALLTTELLILAIVLPCVIVVLVVAAVICLIVWKTKCKRHRRIDIATVENCSSSLSSRDPGSGSSSRNSPNLSKAGERSGSLEAWPARSGLRSTPPV